MLKRDVKLGGMYIAKISGRLAVVKLISESRFGGWNARNMDTGREVSIRSAQKLRREALQTDIDRSEG